MTQTTNVAGASGSLAWAGLVRDGYVYREVQAPRGYELDDTLRTMARTDNGHVITVSNTGDGYVLPSTGGTGTAPLTAAGLLLAAGAGGALLGCGLRRKRERGSTR